MSYLIAIGTALPDYCHKQQDICSFFEKATTDENTRRKLRFISEKSGISERYSVLNDFSLAEKNPALFKNKLTVPSLSDRMAVYKEQALNLALKAILNITQFNDIKNSISHIITVTCTGLFAPGLDIDLVRELYLSPTVQRSSINFMGCNAAILALNAANNICNTHPNSKVLVVCVELCTIHFQNNDTDDFILANTLFADGAAAVLIGSQSLEEKKVKIHSFNSLIIDKGKNDMAWNISETGFIMNLTSYVSALISSNMHAFLKGIDLEKEAIDYWAIHPGGKKIIDDFASVLELKNSELQASYDVLNSYGNMSSPTVLFVLKQVLQVSGNAPIGSKLFSAAFGPGLSIETMQLQYV
ncbi:MAG: type III polyketide synthase [Sediminibacterium sp.]|nr:type III polyketide synthase [Sediminibacterium sp.]